MWSNQTGVKDQVDERLVIKSLLSTLYTRWCRFHMLSKSALLKFDYVDSLITFLL